jgi:hypothetical protein
MRKKNDTKPRSTGDAKASTLDTKAADADVGALVALCLELGRAMGHAYTSIEIEDRGPLRLPDTPESTNLERFTVTAEGGIATTLACECGASLAVALVRLHTSLRSELRAYHRKLAAEIEQARLALENNRHLVAAPYGADEAESP